MKVSVAQTIPPPPFLQQTDKYHMSFWPAGDIKEELGAVNAALSGVPASLVFHQNLDFKLEGNRVPEQYEIKVATNAQINEVYEQVLAYNRVDQDKVTLIRGQRHCDRGDRPELDLPKDKTLYTYIPQLVRDKESERKAKEDPSMMENLFSGVHKPWYCFSQSCVSFVFNLVEMADHVNDGVCFRSQRHWDDPSDTSADFRVPMLADSIVKKYWMTSEKRKEACCLM